jgi:hypothetical protein
MNGLIKNARTFFSRTHQNTPTPAQATPATLPTQNVSENVLFAEQQIKSALSLFEKESYSDAAILCEAVLTFAINTCVESDVEIIKDKLFDAGLEISLAGNNDVANRILYMVFDKPTNPKIASIHGMAHHTEASVCWVAIGPKALPSESLTMLTELEKAICEKEHLQCAPHFLGNIYTKGLYHVKPDNEKAQKYFGIADERGYKQRLIPMRIQGEEYQLMLKAHESNDSIFSDMPLELIKYISHLRIQTTLVQQNLNKIPKPTV